MVYVLRQLSFWKSILQASCSVDGLTPIHLILRFEQVICSGYSLTAPPIQFSAPPGSVLCIPRTYPHSALLPSDFWSDPANMRHQQEVWEWEKTGQEYLPTLPPCFGALVVAGVTFWMSFHISSFHWTLLTTLFPPLFLWDHGGISLFPYSYLGSKHPSLVYLYF